MRQGHILRVALGRSADLPPDWCALDYLDRFRRTSGSDSEGVDGPITYSYVGQDPWQNRIVYDSRGRPYHPPSRRRDREQCEAQNLVQHIAIANRSEGRPDRQTVRKHDRALMQEVKVVAWCADVAEFPYVFLHHWLRMSNLRWAALDFRASFTELSLSEVRRVGIYRYFTVGLMPSIVHDYVEAMALQWSQRVVDAVKELAFPSLESYVNGDALVMAIHVGCALTHADCHFTPLLTGA